MSIAPLPLSAIKCSNVASRDAVGAGDGGEAGAGAAAGAAGVTGATRAVTASATCNALRRQCRKP
jgi:hypothetical protein